MFQTQKTQYAAQQTLKDGQIVIIQHVQTNQYLMTGNIKLNTGSKQFMVGTTPFVDDGRAQWKIKIIDVGSNTEVMQNSLRYPKRQDDEEVWFGDTLVIQNVLTNRYIHFSTDHKSQQKKEAEVTTFETCLDSNERFVISRLQNPFNEKQPNLDPRLYNKIKVKIQNSCKQQYTLQSSDEIFKQNDISEFKEVFGSTKSAGNDEWIIISYPMVNVQAVQLKPQDNQEEEKSDALVISRLPRNQTKLHHKDFVIIRNFQTGSTLHSHGTLYKKGSKQQEVTTKTGLRDDNDLWELVICKKEAFSEKSSGIQMSSTLTKKSSFTLIHNKTNKLLTHVKGNACQNKGHDGLEVCCMETQIIPDEWQIISLHDNQTQLIHLSEPILIQHNPTGYYLATSSNPSVVSGFQLEAFLEHQINQYCIWGFEATKTIYID